MGLIRADQIRNQAGTGNADLFRQWASKAFWNYNSQTSAPTIRDSQNVASLSDNGVGAISVVFSVAFPNANFSTTMGAQPDTIGFNSGPGATRSYYVQGQTVTAVAMVTGYFFNSGPGDFLDFPMVMGTVTRGV